MGLERNAILASVVERTLGWLSWWDPGEICTCCNWRVSLVSPMVST